MYFKDRQQAGVILANSLFEKYRKTNPIVVAIPRGGVPVAQPIAYLLDAPLALIAARKIGAPGNPEFGIGAVSEDGQVWMDYKELGMFKADQAEIDRAVESAMQEMKRQKSVYQHVLKPIDFQGRTVILVDDGLATGATLLAAIRSLKIKGAKEVVVAVPVSSESGETLVRAECDTFFSAYTPRYFTAVGRWYEEFAQVPDSEVIRLLESVNFPPSREIITKDIMIEANHARLQGQMTYPKNCKAWILFAHESESDSKDPKNLEVAKKLNESGYGTLLFDLLTPDEAMIRSTVIDIAFLARRLSQVTRWLKTRPEWKQLPVGYFGVNTGAAAAIQAAAHFEPNTFAVVSRSGRSDLVKGLSQVSCPVLMMVGGEEPTTIEYNQSATKLIPNSKLIVVAGAHSKFDEPGTHEHAIAFTKEWFENSLNQFRRERHAVA